MPNILVIDEGTSSTRAALYDGDLNRGDFFQIEVPLISPRPEIVEQDANLIWQNSLKVAQNASNGIILDAIGITNQRETTILWNKKTGEPVYNALVWQDRRGTDFCEYLRKNGLEEILNKKTGLLADPYFSAFKIKWLLENIAGLKTKAQNGEILFGNVDTWLIWNLTKGQSHVSDYSNASRTGIFNIITGDWDDELLNIFDIPKAILPKVLPSNAHFGYCDIFGGNVPICGVLGDQQAALMGQNCTKEGAAKITFGTGAFLMAQLGEKPKYSTNKMLLTIASNITGKTNYVIEGAVLNAGTAIKWLRDELGIIETADQSEVLAKSIEDNGGVYFVPSFTGLGAPYWNANAKGTIIGLGRKTGRAHLARAAIEASAYQTYDLLKAIEKDGVKIDILRIDGGMTNNDFFCQFLSDICNIEVQRPIDLEMTAMGAARIANMGLGIDINAASMKMKTFKPNMKNEIRKENLSGWARAINATIE